jgi:AraC family transcriptional regulator
MDLIQSLQKAIDYMESNLLGPISYEDAADHVNYSNYHFHRIFSMTTGMTANEYIRSRRLSMAGQEITMSEMKVIDLAMKYGYDSPESFTKAFTRFHGVTPSVARRAGMELKSFNRLLIKIKLEGGKVMDYRIERKEPFTLIAKVERFHNESIKEEGNTEIPDFWKESGRSGVFNVLKQHATSDDLYGVCAPISKESSHFAYGIGMVHRGGEVPEGYTLWKVVPKTWAAFKCIGDSPACIGETWERIFTEFLPGSDYTMLDDTDFELYADHLGSGCFCEIWIPVEKKGKE